MTNEEVLSEVPNNGVLKARLRQSLSEGYRPKKRTAPDALFKILEYQKLLAPCFAPNDTDLSEKKGKPRKHIRGG